jgi:hypothetical protein
MVIFRLIGVERCADDGQRLSQCLAGVNRGSGAGEDTAVLPMNLVAADVRRLTHLRAKIVRASLRRLLRFMDSRRENFFLGSLILTFDRVRNRLKPELQTLSGTSPRGLEFCLQAVSGQNENCRG